MCCKIQCIPHTVILHCMNINSNNTQISPLKKQLRKDLQRVSQILHMYLYLFKLYTLFLMFYIYTSFYEMFSTNNMCIILNLDSILSTFF